LMKIANSPVVQIMAEDFSLSLRRKG